MLKPVSRRPSPPRFPLPQGQKPATTVSRPDLIPKHGWMSILEIVKGSICYYALFFGCIFTVNCLRPESTYKTPAPASNTKVTKVTSSPARKPGGEKRNVTRCSPGGTTTPLKR